MKFWMKIVIKWEIAITIICPRSSYLSYIVIYYKKKWVNTSCTYNTSIRKCLLYLSLIINEGAKPFMKASCGNKKHILQFPLKSKYTSFKLNFNKLDDTFHNQSNANFFLLYIYYKVFWIITYLHYTYLFILWKNITINSCFH